jgi:hypothetical protein
MAAKRIAPAAACGQPLGSPVPPIAVFRRRALTHSKDGVLPKCIRRKENLLAIPDTLAETT